MDARLERYCGWTARAHDVCMCSYSIDLVGALPRAVRALRRVREILIGVYSEGNSKVFSAPSPSRARRSRRLRPWPHQSQGLSLPAPSLVLVARRATVHPDQSSYRTHQTPYRVSPYSSTETRPFDVDLRAHTQPLSRNSPVPLLAPTALSASTATPHASPRRCGPTCDAS